LTIRRQAGSQLASPGELLGGLNRVQLDQQLFLEYQPQVDLRSGEIRGVEALVRWHHPAAGVLYPADFVGLAERNGTISRVTETVMDKALTQTVRWARQGLRLRTGINISARDLADPGFPGMVAARLAQAGVDPAKIDLEIAEDRLGRPEGWLAVRRLRQLGLSVSVDGFGTGFLSTGQLRSEPVDRIKIDRSLVTGIAGSAWDTMVVRNIIEMARTLGTETVAEGVEDLAVAGLLRDLGCDAAQGWLYGRPAAADRIPRPAVGRTIVLPGVAGQATTRVS